MIIFTQLSCRWINRWPSCFNEDAFQAYQVDRYGLLLEAGYNTLYLYVS